MNDDQEVVTNTKQLDQEDVPEADAMKSRILREIQIAIERAKADTPANYSKASHYQYTKS